MKPFSFLVLLGFLLLAGCGGRDEKVMVEEAREPSDPLRNSKLKGSRLENDSWEDRGIEEGDSEMDQEVEDILAQNLSVTELMMHPRVLEAMSSMGEPSGELAVRLASAMQLLESTRNPDSEFARTGKGEPSEAFGSSDPELVRKMVKSALTRDSEGFYRAFTDALERSALQKSFDPEMETKVDFIPKENTILLED